MKTYELYGIVFNEDAKVPQEILDNPLEWKWAKQVDYRGKGTKISWVWWRRPSSFKK